LENKSIQQNKHPFKQCLDVKKHQTRSYICPNNTPKISQKDYKHQNISINMQLKNRLIYSGIISASTLITSILIPIIPCKTAPNIPSSIYKWTLCSLNPDKKSSLGSITEYLGYTSSLQDTYILTLIISFIAAMVFFHYTAGKTRKN
jgi:hypothetical protein